MPGSTKNLRSNSTAEEITLKDVMASIETNKLYMEKEFQSLNHKISKVLDRVEAVELKQTEYEQALTFLGDEVKDLKSKLSELEQRKTTEENLIRKDVSKLQTDKNLTTLTINGIPSTPNENLNLLARKIADATGQSDFTENDIEKVYRSKKANGSGTPSTIIIKFHNMTKRDCFYDSRKTLAKEHVTTKELGFKEEQNVFINEYLSRATQHLFYLARMKRKELSYQFVWTYHCHIFMRKNKTADLIKITDVADLDQL